MEFKQLQSFIEVVNYQSFTKAAEKLFISQPTVSAHITQLEEELHTKLIERTTKSISLTQSGEEVYRYVIKILGLKDIITWRNFSISFSKFISYTHLFGYR